MERETRAESAQRAFARAVDRERDAILRHEAAAVHQDRIAAQLEQHALTEVDDTLRDLALGNAANARDRADDARKRSANARARLLAEGVDPDAGTPGDPQDADPQPPAPGSTRGER